MPSIDQIRKLERYRSDGPTDTDLKGFEHTKENNPVTNHHQPVGKQNLSVSSPTFYEEYFEPFDVCFSFPKEFKKIKDESKIIPAAKAEKIIMRVLSARSSIQQIGDPSSLHKAYEMDISDVRRQYTKGELRDLLMEKTLSMLNRIGCYTAMSASQDQKRIIVRCKLEEEACKRYADQKNYPIQMDYQVTSFDQFKRDPVFTAPYVPYERCIERTTREGSAMERIGHVWQRYDRISRPFNHDLQRGDPELTIFRDIDRIRLLMDALSGYINVTAMEELKFVEAFPLHQPANLHALHENWGSFKHVISTKQPLDQICGYFGEKVALYYAWLQQYCYMLTIPALFGLVLWILEITFDRQMNYNQGWLNYLRVLYCAVVTAWAAWFFQLWQRREKSLRIRWGSEIVTGNLTSPLASPWFKPTCTISDPIHPKGKAVLSTSQTSVYVRRFLAGLVVACVTICAVMVVNDEAVNAFMRILGITDTYIPKMTWQKALKAKDVEQVTLANNSRLASFWFLAFLPLVILVKVVGVLWDMIIVQMVAKFENNQFFEDYYNSVTLYSFIFKFSNHLLPIVYCAFVKEYFGELCQSMDDGRCIKDTRKLLQSFFVAGLVGNVAEIGFPLIKQFLGKRKAKKASEGRLIPFYEVQTFTKPYDTRAQIKDYQEVMLEFCFVALFGVIFPLMPIFNLIVSMVEVRSDAYKMTKVYRRTWPGAAPNGVGSWNTIQRCITFGCVITNVLLCGMVTIGYHRSLIFKLTFSLLLLLIALGFKEFLEYRLPASSKKYRTQRARSHVVHFEAIWGTKNMETKSTPIGI